MMQSSKLIERMICQNQYEDVINGNIFLINIFSYLIFQEFEFYSQIIDIMMIYLIIIEQKDLFCHYGNFQIQQQKIYV
jgi:hypothetical protein